jgi:hypothetical protein
MSLGSPPDYCTTECSVVTLFTGTEKEKALTRFKMSLHLKRMRLYRTGRKVYKTVLHL